MKTIKYRVSYGDENIGEIHISEKGDLLSKSKPENRDRLKRLFLIKKEGETPQEFLENMHLRPYKGYIHVQKV